MTDPSDHFDPFDHLDLRTGDAAASLLGEVLTHLRSAGDNAMCVFDLDSTLLNNRPRQALIMRDFGAANGVAELANATAEHWTGWAYKPAMLNAGLSSERADEVGPAFKAYWEETFFTSELCTHDTPIAGAPEFSNAALATGARVLYVTGRHEGMRAGTVESFQTGGFPLPDGDRVQLFMKPELAESDDAYKARTHAELQGMGSLRAAFDNEPTHINDYQTSFDGALLVHMATDHSMRPVRVHESIPSIRDFSAFIG